MTAPRGQPPLRAGGADPPLVDARRLLDDAAAATAWGMTCGLLQPEDAGRLLRGIAEQGITFDLLGDLCTRLTALLPAVSDPDRVLAALGRLLAAVSSPLSTATLFQRDPGALETLLRIFSAGPHLADVVIADPASWEEVRLGQGKPESMQALRATLDGALAGHRGWVVWLTGIDAPYEAPAAPDIHVRTAEGGLSDCVAQILVYLLPRVRLAAG